MDIRDNMSTFPSKRRRLIPTSLLEKFGARLVRVRKDQLLIEEGNPAVDYLQVHEGQVRMYIINEEGQEFTQGMFGPGESFGEPPLLGDFNYPSSAQAVTEGRLWRLDKLAFLDLLKNNFDLHLKLDKVLCNRLQYKSMILTEISSHDPEHRLVTIMRYFKSKLNDDETRPAIIPFTRQQLADMTGLRVETVIRTIKKMEKEGKLSLEEHKIRF